MRLLLLGYGKMGKAIEQVAIQRGHYIMHKLDIRSVAELTKYAIRNGLTSL